MSPSGLSSLTYAGTPSILYCKLQPKSHIAMLACSARVISHPAWANKSWEEAGLLSWSTALANILICVQTHGFMAPNVSFSLYKSIQVCPGIFVRLLWLISRIPQHFIACLLPSPFPSPSSLPFTVVSPTPCKCFTTVHYSVTPPAVDGCGKFGIVPSDTDESDSPTLAELKTLQYPPRRQQALSGAYIAILV